MTADQRFARWVKIASAALACFFIYYLTADLSMPLTPQAQLLRPVLKIAPRVAGQVHALAVSNNQRVQVGRLLFRLDPQPFELAVQQAELAVEQASQDNAELDAQLGAAQASVRAARARARESNAHAERLRALLGRQYVSRQAYDAADAERLMAQAQLAEAQATVHELQARRGAPASDNLRLRQARNACSRPVCASPTAKYAARAGVVSNLQLSPGAYLAAGAPVAALVTDEVDIIADFREKALRFVEVGTLAEVVFDGRPGELFSARVSHFDAGVSEGQIEANGELAAPVQSERWVRDAQRQRVHLALDRPLPAMLPTGAKATVQLRPFDNLPVRLLAMAQIRLLSLLHYVY
ncbi:HlyD family secretion protein [Pseudomonas lalucatii]|nr:HlyD family secretion protein [Pseudomonas lalucatii]